MFRLFTAVFTEGTVMTSWLVRRFSGTASVFCKMVNPQWNGTCADQRKHVAHYDLADLKHQ